MKLLQYFRKLLYPFSIIYHGITACRNYLYDSKKIKSASFSIPVINVGNLSTGGTGKTPHIEYLINLLQNTYEIATLSRGYKRKSKGFVLAVQASTAQDIGDEPLQFYQKFPSIKVAVCEARILGIPHLVHLFPSLQVILLDDAYQHRSVSPGMNILITDFKEPYFRDCLLPAGNLRESSKGAERADIIIVSKCPKDITPITMQEYINAIRPANHQQVFFSGIKYGFLKDFYTKTTTLSLENSHEVLLLTGIGKPQFMKQYVEKQVYNVQHLSYPDHHLYTEEDLKNIKQRFEQMHSTTKIILTTEKDASRLAMYQETLAAWQLPIYTLPIEVYFIDNGTDFDTSILQYIEQADYKPEEF